MSNAFILRRSVNNSGGGLSNLNAILCVTVPQGSTVTATKSNFMLTPTLWTQNADATLETAIFTIIPSYFDANPWTITCTSNGQTSTGSVIINSAEYYEVVLSFNYYFIKNGELLDDNWVIHQGSSSSANIYPQPNLDYVLFDTGGNIAVAFATTNSYDITQYTKLQMTVSAGRSYYTATKAPCIAVDTRQPTGSGTSASLTNLTHRTMLNGSTGNIQSNTYILDISSLTGNYYVGVTLAGSSQFSGQNATLNITELAFIQ